jgi:hypothetical protein
VQGSAAPDDGPHQQRHFGGSLSSFTANLDGAGAWYLDGKWSLDIKGRSGKGDFSVGLNMARAATEPRQPHTHHLSIRDGAVTMLPNGYHISGTAVITINGTVAPFSGSPVDVDITGGDTVEFSNLAVVFGNPAAGHFGTAPITGVVTTERR